MTCLLPQLHILSSIAYSFEQYGNYLSFHERAFLFFYSVLPPPILLETRGLIASFV